MKKNCPVCGLGYFREPGYYIGAMILNYGITAALILGLYVASLRMSFELPWSPTTRLFLWMGVGAALSLATMRHAYSLWLSLDYWFEPWPEKDAE